MRTFVLLGTAATFALFTAAAGAADHVISQKNGTFNITNLKAKVGDEVSFRNDDTVFHNIFSLSSVQSFDLGSYAPGAAKKVKVDKAGKIDVECAIHPGMTMVIDVAR